MDAPGEERVGDLSKLHACEDSSGLEHSVGLLKDGGDVGAVSDSERDRVQVERRRWDVGGESLSVAVRERHLGSCSTKIGIDEESEVVST